MKITSKTVFFALVVMVLTIWATPETWTIVSRTSDETPTVAVKVADVAPKVSSLAVRAKSKVRSHKTVIKSFPANVVDSTTRDITAQTKGPRIRFLK